MGEVAPTAGNDNVLASNLLPSRPPVRRAERGPREQDAGRCLFDLGRIEPDSF